MRSEPTGARPASARRDRSLGHGTVTRTPVIPRNTTPVMPRTPLVRTVFHFDRGETATPVIRRSMALVIPGTSMVPSVASSHSEPQATHHSEWRKPPQPLRFFTCHSEERQRRGISVFGTALSRIDQNGFLAAIPVQGCRSVISYSWIWEAIFTNLIPRPRSSATHRGTAGFPGQGG